MSVRMPAQAHTSRTPVVDPTAPETSEGCTKIDAPMIVPTTIAVARPVPIARTGCGADGGREGDVTSVWRGMKRPRESASGEVWRSGHVVGNRDAHEIVSTLWAYTGYHEGGTCPRSRC